MRLNFVLLSAFLAFVCPASPAAGQSFQPKSIQFVGAHDYAQEELLSAADLKPGLTLSSAEMNAYAQKLLDTGMFANVAFKFDGQDLIFQLAPATGLLPMQLRNFPFPAGKDLDDKLHRQFPLYHGLLPEQGGLTESVRGALEQMLAQKGIHASVIATPSRDTALNKTVAVDFAITAPPVLVGELQTQGAIVALDPKASALLAKFPGAPYDVQGTANQIETSLNTYYKDLGYLEPTIHATAGEKPVLSPDAVRVPFRVSILPGVQFKLAAVQLTPGLLVSQADFDHQSGLHAGDIPDGERLRSSWKFIDRQYHNHGYIKAKVEPAATLDHANKTVSYVVSVDPGSQYVMGNLTIENVTDELRTAMLAAWKMPAGSVFNEGAVLGFFATHGVNPALERVFADVNVKYTLHPNDNAHTVDLTLVLEPKH